MNWDLGIPAAVTVCDEKGVIIHMNEKSRRTFASSGDDLVGRSLLDCHPEPARSKLQDMLQRPRENAYTIEKAGKKKLIYQAPWTRDGAFAGLVEISIELPENMPHFVRQPK